MGLGEVVYRLGNQVTLWRERTAVRQPDHGYSPYPFSAEIFPRFKKKGLEPFFFSSQDKEVLRSQVQQQFSEGAHATMNAAELLLKNEISLFGRTLQLDDPINWFKDPLTKNVWPQAFWAAIQIRDGETIGGVKWVRELNRHHHFVTLGKAYWLSGEEQFAETLCNQLSSWINNNPPFMGVNWSSALGNAIRVINWIWALHFIHHSPALNEGLFGRIIAALAAQTAFIGRHLSKYSSANNHLIGEAAGLAFVGLTLPWLREANSWQNKGMTILTEEIEKQIYPDGVMAEQAINYLAFDLDFYLLVWQAAVLKGIEIPAIWQERVEKASDFICHIMDKDGRVPAIGDSDDGRVLDLDERPNANRFRAILATTAVLLEQPNFKVQAGKWDEKSHWLLGEVGQKKFDNLEAQSFKPTSNLFRTGGYCLMRHGDRQLLFDSGPLGYLSLAAHGHADALNLLLNVSGEQVLIDPGTFAYREGGVWRRFFRGTSAHNTIVIDGYNQSEMLGDFLWGQRAKTRLLNWQSNDEFDLCTAEHNGYYSLNVTHRRTVLFYKPDWVLVEDWLDGEGVHQVQQNWHFPIHSQVGRMEGHFIANVFLVKVNNTTVQISIAGTDSLSARVVKGESNPIQGWVSEQYGHKEPAPVLALSGSCHLPFRIATVFNLGQVMNSAELSAMKIQLQQIAEQS